MDDDDDIREILSCGISLLSAAAVLPRTARNRHCPSLHPEPIEVVISDVQMKGMSGLELCRHIKDKEEYDADVIIITGLVNNFAYEEIIGQRVPAILSRNLFAWPKSWPA